MDQQQLLKTSLPGTPDKRIYALMELPLFVRALDLLPSMMRTSPQGKIVYIRKSREANPKIFGIGSTQRANA